MHNCKIFKRYVCGHQWKLEYCTVRKQTCATPTNSQTTQFKVPPKHSYIPSKFPLIKERNSSYYLFLAQCSTCESATFIEGNGMYLLARCTYCLRKTSVPPFRAAARSVRWLLVVPLATISFSGVRDKGTDMAILEAFCTIPLKEDNSPSIFRATYMPTATHSVGLVQTPFILSHGCSC